MRRRGDRAKPSERRKALDKIKRLRNAEYNDNSDDEEGKERAIDGVDFQEDGLYREMTEDEYQHLVRSRRDETPFVENDDVALGYFDDGEEQFFEKDDTSKGQYDDEEGEEDDDDAHPKSKGSGALSMAYARKAKKKQRMKLGEKGASNTVKNMFFNPAAIAAKKTSSTGFSSKRGAKKDIDLDSMLDDLTSNPLQSSRSSISSNKRYKSSRKDCRGKAATGTRKTTFEYKSNIYTPKSRGAVEDRPVSPGQDEFTHPVEDIRTMDEDPDQDDDYSMEIDHVSEEHTGAKIHDEKESEETKPDIEVEEKPVVAKPSKRDLMLQKAKEKQLCVSQATKKALEAATAIEMEEEESGGKEEDQDEAPQPSAASKNVPSNEVSEWWASKNSPAVSTEAEERETMGEQVEDVVSENGVLRMFWLDIVEIRDRKGKLYLIGKIKDGQNGYKSCCVTINNLNRYLYVVPKVKTSLMDMSEDERNQVWMDMHNELSNLLIPSIISGIKAQKDFSSKLVKRNYAFEIPDMPREESLYLKLKYPAKYDAPPARFCDKGGQTFSRIFGRETSAVESFILHRKFLGPGWIEIKNARAVKPMNSYCKLEFELDDAKDVVPIHKGLSPPPLKVMSLALKTSCHAQSHKHEIVALSAIVQPDVACEGSSKTISNFEHYTLIRPMGQEHGQERFPPTYASMAARDPRFRDTKDFRMLLNERALLTYFLTRVQRDDPDVIVGHNLHKYELDVLLSRMDHYNLGGQWSKLSRLRRGRLSPYKVGEGWNEYRLEDLSNGRLVCDTYVSAKELLSSQPNYTLTSLVLTQLRRTRVDVDIVDIPNILTNGGPEAFIDLCRHTSDDALFVLYLMHQLEILPLSKQLANLCGYFWNRTLSANKRAERIEYLLLHEFSRSGAKYILPDKIYPSSAKEKKKKTKDPSYEGGMVFAPKKGLYDNFVVLLDFNSLYPSIIREYNLCFTTVERVEEHASITPVAADETTATKTTIPELPSSSTKEGVLPGVISRLLESRKQVKKELKLEKMKGHNNEDKVNRLDIRQKAIKLTANSIYGCLGFKNSRFFAKPIAALITQTGRQTLMRAKEVAEQECGYDVVYGDTDSIMVDSRSTNLAEAKKIGAEIQHKCNKKFKLLELEVDYIFKCILLLQKKKYAAIVIHEGPPAEVGGPPSLREEKEVKGLDMVRRDWCQLSKTMGNQVLDYVLSGKTKDEVVELIHEYCSTMGESIRQRETTNLEDFVITKSLNKDPEQYPDKSKQYHVQVALALRAQGQPIGAGCTIPYVLCREVEESSGRKAYHPHEIERSNGKLHVDLDWYFEAQIHPPINRLCLHIDGTSSPQIAHCLGLDASKFSHAAMTTNAEEEDELAFIPSVLQQDTDRFKDCLPLTITCAQCQGESNFPGVFSTPRVVETTPSGRENEHPITSGLRCPNESCQSEFYGLADEGLNGQRGDNCQALLSNRLTLLVRACTSRYYQGSVICEDVMCRHQTQQQSLRLVSGQACLGSSSHCRGPVHLEYSEKQLYTQLKYLQSLFDVKRAQDRLAREFARKCSQSSNTSAANRVVPELSGRHEAVFEALYDQLDHAIRRNEYNWVSPSIWSTLFST